MINGVITTRHVLAHAPLIVRLYGWSLLARCAGALLAGRQCTFLSLVWEG